MTWCRTPGASNRACLGIFKIYYFFPTLPMHFKKQRPRLHAHCRAGTNTQHPAGLSDGAEQGSSLGLPFFVCYSHGGPFGSTLSGPDHRSVAPATAAPETPKSSAQTRGRCDCHSSARRATSRPSRRTHRTPRAGAWSRSWQPAREGARHLERTRSLPERPIQRSRIADTRRALRTRRRSAVFRQPQKMQKGRLERIGVRTLDHLVVKVIAQLVRVFLF